MIKKNIIILAVIVIASIFRSWPVSAQAQKTSPLIRVSPVILNLSLSPGQLYTYELQVENLSSSPLPVRAFLDNFIDQNEDGGYNFDTVLQKNPLLTWTHLSEDNFILAAHEIRNVTMTIKIPQIIPFGGYYGLVFFEPVLPKKNNEQTLVTARIGILLLANVGTFSSNGPKGEIMAFSLDKWLYGSEPLQLLLRVKNSTLGHYSAKPIFSITPLFGEKKQYELEEKIVFPGKIRRWTEAIMYDLLPGYYSTGVSVSVGKGEKIIARSQFIVFPYKEAAALVIIFGLISFILLQRKRIKKALGVILHG